MSSDQMDPGSSAATASGVRLEHMLCYSDAVSIDDHAAQYADLGFVPQAHAARWPPGLRNRFVGLWPEYLELVGVEDEAAFAASADPIRAFRPDGRPFGLGIVTDDVAALHDAWTARGIALPPVSYESPAGSDPAAGPLFGFQHIPPGVLPGVDAFALTSYYRPVPPTRRQVWVSPNSTFGLDGITFVSTTPGPDAQRWQELLAPHESVGQTADGYQLWVGPHRLSWLAPDALRHRYGWTWTPGATGADAMAVFELLALDPDEVGSRAAAVGRPARRLADGGLAIEPSPYDGFRFVVRAGDLDAWVCLRDERLGVAHEVLRMDEFAARGTPGPGEYVVRTATVADLPGIRALGEAVLPATYASITPEGYPDMILAQYWSDAANTAAIASSTDVLLVAESPSAGIVGVAHSARYDGHSVVLWRLYVLPRLHGHGLGSALLAECARRCPADIDRLVTEYVGANTAAARFYAGQGFGRPRPETQAWRDTHVGIVYVDRPMRREADPSA